MNVRVFNHSAIILRFEMVRKPHWIDVQCTNFLKHTFLCKYFCLWSKARWICRFLGCFRKIAKSDYLLRHVCPSVHLTASNNSAPTGRIFMKFYVGVFFKNLARKFKFHYDQTKITGTLLEDEYIFFIISRSFLLRMGNVSDKSCRGIKQTFWVQ